MFVMTERSLGQNILKQHLSHPWYIIGFISQEKKKKIIFCYEANLKVVLDQVRWGSHVCMFRTINFDHQKLSLFLSNFAQPCSTFFTNQFIYFFSFSSSFLALIWCYSFFSLPFLQIIKNVSHIWICHGARLRKHRSEMYSRFSNVITRIDSNVAWGVRDWLDPNKVERGNIIWQSFF